MAAMHRMAARPAAKRPARRHSGRRRIAGAVAQQDLTRLDPLREIGVAGNIGLQLGEGERSRLEGMHASRRADKARDGQGVGADIGADIKRHVARLQQPPILPLRGAFECAEEIDGEIDALA